MHLEIAIRSNRTAHTATTEMNYYQPHTVPQTDHNCNNNNRTAY